MLCYGNGFIFCNLAVPQGCIFPFTEFLSTMGTAQVANLSASVGFANRQVALSGQTIADAFRVDAR
jgi:hypothetical protein